MRILILRFIASVSLLLLSNGVNAELIQEVVLSSGSNTYSTSATSDSLRHAWVYAAPYDDGSGDDIWNFDLTAFDANYYVNTSVSVQDYCCHADDYNLYWDGILLGNTGLGTLGEFSFDTTSSDHQLTVEWLNPILGGSWYNIFIEANQGSLVPGDNDGGGGDDGDGGDGGNTTTVPVPSIIALFVAGLFGLGFARRLKA